MTNEELLDKFRLWREDVDSGLTTRFDQTRSFMHDIFGNSRPSPIAVMWNLRFEIINDKIYLIFESSYVHVFSTSLNEIHNHHVVSLMSNSDFIGVLSKKYGIQYYFDQIAKLYPDYKIVVNAGEVKAMAEVANSLVIP